MKQLYTRVTGCSKEGHSFTEPFHVIITALPTIPMITHFHHPYIHHHFLNSVAKKPIECDETGYFHVPAAGVFSKRKDRLPPNGFEYRISCWRKGSVPDKGGDERAERHVGDCPD